MSFTVGPKELYLSTDDYLESVDILSKDDQSSVVWFQNLQQKERGEFLNGGRDINNVLIMAAKKANVTLLKYICEHIEDPRVINMQDGAGRTALTYSVHSNDASLEKIMVCMKILLAHGADTDVMEGMIRKPSKFDVKIEASVCGNNVAGTEFSMMVNAYNTYHVNPCNLVKAEKAFELLLENGATCFMRFYYCRKSVLHGVAIGQVDAAPSVNETDSPQLEDLKRWLSSIVKQTHEKTQKTLFSQVRSLRLAAGSIATASTQGSPIAELPLEIRNLIEEKLYQDVSMCISDKEKELTKDPSAICTLQEFMSKRN